MKNKFQLFGIFKSKQKQISSIITNSGIFDPAWYKATYSQELKGTSDLLSHYIAIGDKQGFKPNKYFDPTWYRGRAGGARKQGINALAHYLTIGWKKGFPPSSLFNGELYAERYPAYAPNEVSPLEHYICIGQFEGKIAFPDQLIRNKNSAKIMNDMQTIHDSGLFLSKWFESYYADFWVKDTDPLYYYVTSGHIENRQPNPIFNGEWYRRLNMKNNDDQNPLIHYIETGARKNLDPAPDFCSLEYFNIHDGISPKTDNPLYHYIKNGLSLGEKRPSRTTTLIEPTKKLTKKIKLPVHDGLRGMVDFEKCPLSPTSLDFKSSKLSIHWVVPDFAEGGGGHMTIFRMLSYLEKQGHKQTVWINNPNVHATEQEASDSILKYFQQFTGKVKFLDKRFKKAKGDIIVATDCWTVWPVLSAENFKRRFYFVQDFEPSFHPMGANYLAAEQTYHEDLDCICASPWLSKVMQEKYGRWARPFWLAADKEIYHPVPKQKPNKHPRIAFYARHFTARRAVELGMLALEILAKRNVDFEVDFFGAPLEFNRASFKFKDHGVASPEELASIFQKADVGVVFSATNYSLVPQEMMACGLPIVELKGENTECIFPKETVTFAEPNPHKIADSIESLISDTRKRQKQSLAARKWVDSFDWKSSAELVENAFIDRLTEIGTDIKPKASNSKSRKIKASVIIPTLNAGKILRDVLEATTSQIAPWSYEILVIDSGSTDETLDIVAQHPTVKLHKIDTKDFNHGDTRNLGAELTSGEFIAFLTHDAKPANSNWLYNLVSSLEQHPEAAGAYGKHLPYPDASAYTKRDLNDHFNLMAQHPLCISKGTNQKRFDRGDTQWRQFLHFYSDNNSCMRRSVWEKIPYRRIKYGEDQVWADDIIKAGYSKIYAVRAVVYHSHDYNPDQNFERSFTEAAFFKHFFGYELITSAAECEKNTQTANEHDRSWGKKRNLSEKEISKREQLNEARFKGYLKGFEADTSQMF